MLYHPDLIMYFWLVPVFIIFFLPLLFVPLGVLCDKFLAIKAQAAYAVQPANGYGLQAADDKREYARKAFDGIIAHVSDGINYCTCSVNDVSKKGIRLVNPSDALDTTAERLGVLLTGRGKCFQMQVKPKWNNPQGPDQSIGATIEDIFWDWKEFEQHIEGVQPAA